VRVLITNIILGGRTGTEIATIDLAQGLAHRGHQVAVYSPFTGPSASVLVSQGIAVTHQIDNLPWKPDIIHGHHNIALVPVLARYLDVPALFVMHDATQELNCPPSTPQIVRLFAVDEINREHYARQANIDPTRIDLLLNCVDLDHFQPRGPLPERPKHALLLSKNAGHIDAVREAARGAGLTLDETGPIFGRVVDDLHARLRNYDVVFATARMALEALAVGCSVIVCDGRGLAGTVTSDVVDKWRIDNFGLKLLIHPPKAETVSAQIQRYNPHDAALVSARIRAIASLSDQLDRIETIHHDIVSSWTCSLDDQRQHSQALGTFIATWVHDRGYPVISRNTAPASENEKILESRSRLFAQLCLVTVRKLRRDLL
jgi:hypothetical protein